MSIKLARAPQGVRSGATDGLQNLTRSGENMTDEVKEKPKRRYVVTRGSRIPLWVRCEICKVMNDGKCHKHPEPEISAILVDDAIGFEEWEERMKELDERITRRNEFRREMKKREHDLRK